MAEAKLDKRIELIGERCKELRKKAGYESYEIFSYEKGISRGQYWRIESGVNMRLSSLFKVLDSHGITMKEFFETIDENEEKKNP